MAGAKIPQSEYRSHPATSKSDLFKITKSPLHFKWAMENIEDKTPALVFGSACHKYVLEKEDFDKEFAVMPDINRRTKAGREEYEAFLAVNDGKDVISPDDFEKTKSSKFVWYLLRDEKIKYHKVFTEKELVFCDICQVSWIENIKPSEKVFLVDDFIGSGETAEKAINWYINHHNIKLDKIAILALAAQRAGIEALQQKGIEVYTYYCFDKGISDFYTGDELDKYTTLMEKIESKLKVDARYNFGYNRSEALVALTRAPNNTFPVFWRKNGKNKIVPFPRD